VQIDERCVVILGGDPLQPDMIGPLAAEAGAPDWIVGGSRVKNRTFRPAAPSGGFCVRPMIATFVPVAMQSCYSRIQIGDAGEGAMT
jgi:hypothetical protein